MPAVQQQYKAEEFVIQTPPCRIVFADVVAPASFRGEDGNEGLPRYALQYLIPKGHPRLPALQAVLLKVAKEDFPGRFNAEGGMVEQIAFPLKDGDRINEKRGRESKKEYDFYAGHMILFAHKNEKSIRTGQLLVPPYLVVMQQGKQADYSAPQLRPLAKEFFYNGVLAAIAFSLSTYTGLGGGVTCRLDRLLSLNTGDAINIGRSNEDVFGAPDVYTEFVGHATTESPSAGMAVPAPASPW